MHKLLITNITRLKKDTFFRIGMIFMLSIGILMPVKNYLDTIKTGYPVYLDNILFFYAALIPFLSSVFCSLFIGTEYSDGTIRNKLVVGHSRIDIYLSNFLISAAAGLFMCLSFLLTACTFGIPLLGGLDANTTLILLLLLASVMMLLAFTSIFTLISMLCQNKAVAAVINIMGVVVLFIYVSWIYSSLIAPEFYENVLITDTLGNVSQDLTPNPFYLRGTARIVYQFFLDFLPTGQAMQISGMSALHLWQMPVYSLIITVLTTASGLFFFRKKDLK